MRHEGQRGEGFRSADEHAPDQGFDSRGVQRVGNGHLGRRRVGKAGEGTGKGNRPPVNPCGAHQNMAVPAVDEIISPVPENVERKGNVEGTRQIDTERMELVWWWHTI